jgi:hypothetical protein
MNLNKDDSTTAEAQRDGHHDEGTREQECRDERTTETEVLSAQNELPVPVEDQLEEARKELHC